MRVESRNRRVPRAPLPVAGVTRSRGDLQGRLRGHYSSFLAHTGSCVRPSPSRRLGGPSYAGSLQVVASPLLGDGPSRHYLCNPCVGAWTHTPPRLSSALAHSFLESTGLTPRKMRSAREIVPCNATSTGSRISGLQSFVYLQAPTLARPPDCIHRSIFVLGGRAVYTTHRPGGYPFRDVASLRVRLGQLTRLDLHQLDCSLVGCSLPHPAPRQTASLRAVAYPLVQEARRWPPPSLRRVWPVRLSVVVTWRRDPTSVCWPSFPPPVPPAGAPFPPRGLVGSIPPLRRYYETLRLLAAHPPALRCLRPAVPSEHLRFAPSDARCDVHGLGLGEPVPAPRRS